MNILKIYLNVERWLKSLNSKMSFEDEIVISPDCSRNGAGCSTSRSYPWLKGSLVPPLLITYLLFAREESAFQLALTQGTATLTPLSLC